MKKIFNPRMLTIMALLIASNVVLVRFLSFETPIMRVDLGFVSNAMAGMILGPLGGGITAALSDILGLLIKGDFARYFPGFTVNAFLYGIIYGAGLFKKEKNWLRISLTVITAVFIMGIALTPIWLYIINKFINGKDAFFFTILSANILKNLIMIPIQIIVIKILSDYALPHIKGPHNEK